METWESSLRLWYPTLGRTSCRTVPVSLFVNAAPDPGGTFIVNLVKAYDQISWISSLCVILHVSHITLHPSDGMNYLVVDGVNSLRKGSVWWCPWVLNPSSWGIPSTCASTLFTGASSEPRATTGTVEFHHAKVGSNQWAPGRTIITSSTISRFLLLWLLGNKTSGVCWGDRSTWS
jgi:hypothetical protein